MEASVSARDQVRRGVVSSQAPAVARRDTFRSTDVDLDSLRDFVRRAVHDTGWGPESLSAKDAMDRDKSYISRVLSGDKPLNLDFILSLPADAQDAFAALYAEHRGWLVARPAVSQDAAVRQLVSGLLGVLAGNVIGSSVVKARMAKAELREDRAEKVG